jgi:HEAT repeat protein
VVAVLEALGQIGGESAFAVLARFGRSETPEIAKAAEVAMKALQARMAK